MFIFINNKSTLIKRFLIDIKKLFDIRLFDEINFSFVFEIKTNSKNMLLLKREIFFDNLFNFLRYRFLIT